MKERYTEIRFYYWLMKLMKKFQSSVHILDIIEAYCNLGNIDSSVIKTLLKQVRSGTSIIDTYKEEAVYIGRQMDISYRNLQHETGVSISTQVRYNKYYNDHPDMYIGIQGHLDRTAYIEVERFMDMVDTMKEL